MKIAIRYTLILTTIVLSGCSHYSHRMVRVKNYESTKSPRHKTRIKAINNLDQSDRDSIGLNLGDIEFASCQHNVIELNVTRKTTQVKNNFRFEPIYLVGNEELRIGLDSIILDSIVTNNPEKEMIEQKYNRANSFSVAALVLLLATPLTGGISVLGALFFSILAVRIYLKYENPGVKERYVMALSVLVGSFLLIALIAGLLIYFLGFLL